VPHGVLSQSPGQPTATLRGVGWVSASRADTAIGTFHPRHCSAVNSAFAVRSTGVTVRRWENAAETRDTVALTPVLKVRVAP
jgi:hypothetical protein